MEASRCHLYTPLCLAPASRCHFVLSLCTLQSTSISQKGVFTHSFYFSALFSWGVFFLQLPLRGQWGPVFLGPMGDNSWRKRLTDYHSQALQTADWNAFQVIMFKRPICLSRTLGLKCRLLVWHMFRNLRRCSQGMEAGGHSLWTTPAILWLAGRT